jgi:hypothetical protein
MRVQTFLIVVALLMPWPDIARAGTPGWLGASNSGCQIWNPGVPSTWSAYWAGGCENGRAQGQGVLRWTSSGHLTVRYEGGMVAGKLEGRGVMTFPNGERRESQWHDNNRNGPGMTLYRNGDRYTGGYRDDRMSGHGVLAFANGDRYDGEFLDDAFAGHGIKTWPNGDRYDGEWRGGKANGEGHLVSGGKDFDGVWRDGCFRTDKGWIAIDVDVASCR